MSCLGSLVADGDKTETKVSSKTKMEEIQLEILHVWISWSRHSDDIVAVTWKAAWLSRRCRPCPSKCPDSRASERPHVRGR